MTCLGCWLQLLAFAAVLVLVMRANRRAEREAEHLERKLAALTLFAERTSTLTAQLHRQQFSERFLSSGIQAKEISSGERARWCPSGRGT